MTTRPSLPLVVATFLLGVAFGELINQPAISSAQSAVDAATQQLRDSAEMLDQCNATLSAEMRALAQADAAVNASRNALQRLAP